MPRSDESSTGAPAPFWHPSTPARIVVAEGDDELRDLLMSKLLDEGYEVHGVSSAHELLHLLAAAGCTIPPVDGAELIVVDQNLPYMSGLDLIRSMRRAHSRIPFLLMTALPTRELVSESKRLRVPLLVKPFSLSDLSNAALLLLLTVAVPPDDKELVAIV
jgi:DNA-binding response OmpR family regulator